MLSIVLQSLPFSDNTLLCTSVNTATLDDIQFSSRMPNVLDLIIDQDCLLQIKFL